MTPADIMLLEVYIERPEGRGNGGQEKGEV